MLRKRVLIEADPHYNSRKDTEVTLLEKGHLRALDLYSDQQHGDKQAAFEQAAAEAQTP